MDAVYRVRKSGLNEELRYSLRALAAFLPVDRVWLVGHRPRWVVNVEYIVSEVRGTTYHCSLTHLTRACEHPDVSEEFVLLDDDFFVLRRMERPPVAHMGPIASVLPEKRDKAYRKALEATEKTLWDWGYPDPLCYELHIPIVLEKALVLEVAERAGEGRLVGAGIRSLYGNVAALGGERMDDVKVGYMRVPVDLDSRSFISTNDSSFRGGLVGKAIRERFPDPSRYEK